jgi:hypothetical protein
MLPLAHVYQFLIDQVAFVFYILSDTKLNLIKNTHTQNTQTNKQTKTQKNNWRALTLFDALMRRD